MEAEPSWKVSGFDNLIRRGSETNRRGLERLGIRVAHADLRCPSDLDGFRDVDWVVDAAALPSVLAGIDRTASSRQLVEHNLVGTVNLLELCKTRRAGIVMLSTSRVYSVAALSSLPLTAVGQRFVLRTESLLPAGVSAAGVTEQFSVAPPLSLYGTSKIASEYLAIEYGAAFDFPVWINRCGILAGAGQFGHAEQGILSYWIHAWASGAPLRYIGFDGKGHQLRDALHPRDLATLVQLQIKAGSTRRGPTTANVSGGLKNSISLAELSDWCANRFGARNIGAESSSRPFDVPWLVLDSTPVREQWGWQPAISLPEVLEEIAANAEADPDWLKLSSA